MFWKILILVGIWMIVGTVVSVSYLWHRFDRYRKVHWPDRDILESWCEYVNGVSLGYADMDPKRTGDEQMKVVEEHSGGKMGMLKLILDVAIRWPYYLAWFGKLCDFYESKEEM